MTLKHLNSSYLFTTALGSFLAVQSEARNFFPKCGTGEFKEGYILLLKAN